MTALSLCLVTHPCVHRSFAMHVTDIKAYQYSNFTMFTLHTCRSKASIDHHVICLDFSTNVTLLALGRPCYESAGSYTYITNEVMYADLLGPEIDPTCTGI